MKNCLKKIFIVPFVILLLLSFTRITLAAYTSLSLSPGSGTIDGDGTQINVLVNSGSDEFVGVDTDLLFDGSVEYVSSTGAQRCSSFNVTAISGGIHIECLSVGHSPGEAYDGTVATLVFKSTGSGESTFSFSSTDPSDIGSVSGGVYELTTSTSGGTDLPETGIFDNSIALAIIGFLLFLSGLYFVTFTEKIETKVIDNSRSRLESKFN